MKHLLRSWKIIQRRLAGKRLFILTDFDGTIVPIAKTPDQAVLPEATRVLLRDLAEHPQCTVAVVSGRALKDLKKRIRIKKVIYVGNHGLEMEGPYIRARERVTPRQKALIQKMYRFFARRLKHIPGIVIQNKILTLSIHYRLIQACRQREVREIVREICLMPLWQGQIQLRKGKKVYEILPATGWNKGKAVMWLLAQPFFSTKGGVRVFPVYLGDDVTDEDVFVLLKKIGLTVFVGESNRFSSEYYAKTPEETVEFFNMIRERTLMPRGLSYRKNRTIIVR